MYRLICLRLLRQTIRWPFALAKLNAGNNIPARIAMSAMTTSSSMRVKAVQRDNPEARRQGLVIRIDFILEIQETGWEDIGSEDRRTQRETHNMAQALNKPNSTNSSCSTCLKINDTQFTLRVSFILKQVGRQRGEVREVVALDDELLIG